MPTQKPQELGELGPLHDEVDFCKTDRFLGVVVVILAVDIELGTHA